MPRIFVYGTLQHPPLLERLLGRVPDGEPATLAGHRAAPLGGRVYPGLLVESGAEASGRILEVDDQELEVLDAFEGPGYGRVTVRPTTPNGQVEADAWLLRGPDVAGVLPGDWDLDRFVAEHADEWLGGSTAGAHHPG